MFLRLFIGPIDAQTAINGGKGAAGPRRCAVIRQATQVGEGGRRKFGSA